MQVIARSLEQASEPVVVLPNLLLPPGAGVVVGQSDAVVFTRDGVVAGVLGPGSHALDPNALPFLWNLRDPSGQQIQTTLIFVSMAALSGRWALTQEPARAHGTGHYRVVDPALLVRQTNTDPGGFMKYLLGGESVQRAVGQAVNEALASGWQIPQLAADTPRLAERAKQLAAAELSPYGVELFELSELALSGAAEQAQPSAPQASAAVYEMLWDCRHCGAKKLLGKTHRCCPNCGSPQDVGARYFPSDDEKVAVKDHVYYGADRICRYCQNGNGRNSKHCGTCGGPLDEGSDVQRRSDQVHAIGAYSGENADAARREFSGVAKPSPPAPKKRSWGLILGGIAGCLVLSFLTLIVVMVVWTKPAGLEVAGHEWKREIDVERFGPVEETDWCDSVPSGAVVKGRSRAVRSHEQIQKGEKCSNRKTDNGDGTFSESRECEPVYEDKPVYDSECRYTINKWSKQRTLTAAGAALADEPKWPEVALAQKGDCLGCEREGKRNQSYTVRFVEPKTKEQSSCTFEQGKWQTFKPGSKWIGEVGVIGGILNCSSLKQN